MARGPRPAQPDEPSSEAAPGATMIYTPSEPLEAPAPVAAAPVIHAALSFAGQRHELTQARMVLGRSKDCDLQVLDPNVSRRHAEVRFDDGVYTVVDLGSTNGIEVDGSRVDVLVLDDGTRFTVGSTEVVFTRETR